MTKLLAISSCLLMLQGCGYLKKWLGYVVQKPKIELVAIKVKGLDLRGIDAELILQVSNPNDFEIKMEKLKYSVDVEEKNLAHGRLESQTRWPAMSSQIMNLPLEISTVEAVKIAGMIILKGKKFEARWSVESEFDSLLGQLVVTNQGVTPFP